jgi:Large ribosomal RNA subunit accumulation protein YceD
MQEHQSDDVAKMPWRVPVAVEDIPEAGERFTLVADAPVRAAIARTAGLRDLPRLVAEFKVTRRGPGGLHVVGRISATVGQNCVVTLEPLVNEIGEDIDLIFMPQVAIPEDAGGEDAEPNPAPENAPDDAEPLVGGVIDLGALAIEFLILGLDPYPRKPGAVFEPPAQPEQDSGPFAALSGWAKGRDDEP